MRKLCCYCSLVASHREAGLCIHMLSCCLLLLNAIGFWSHVLWCVSCRCDATAIIMMWYSAEEQQIVFGHQDFEYMLPGSVRASFIWAPYTANLTSHIQQWYASAACLSWLRNSALQLKHGPKATLSQCHVATYLQAFFSSSRCISLYHNDQSFHWRWCAFLMLFIECQYCILGSHC